MAIPVFLYKFEGDDLKLQKAYPSISKACKELSLKRTTAGYHLEKENHYDFGDGILLPEMLEEPIEEIKPIAPKVSLDSDEEYYGDLKPLPIKQAPRKPFLWNFTKWLFG